MMTENYKKIMHSLANANRSVSLTDINGNSVSFNSSSPFTNASNQKIIVGSGTTAPSKSDYCLVNALELIVNTDVNINNLEMHLGATIYNNTSSEVTINEIGRVLYTSSTNVLISRKVLDSPITLSSGEAIRIIYEIT